MKYTWLFIMSLLFVSFAFCQNSKPVAQEVQNRKDRGEQPQKYSLFLDSNTSNTHDFILEYVSIQKEVLDQIHIDHASFIEIEIPFQGETVTLELYKAELFTPTFEVTDENEQPINYSPGLYFRGIIQGDNQSLVSFNVFENEVNAVISSQQLHNLTLGKVLDDSGLYALYFENQFEGDFFTCETSDEVAKTLAPSTQKTTQSLFSTNCVTLYFEMGYDLYVQNGNDTTATMNWMTSVYNNVQTIYTNDNITTALNDVLIWTTEDPYEPIANSIFEYLLAFRNYRKAFDADIGHLIGVDNAGGGVASTIDGFCCNLNYCYSSVAFSYNTVPVYSWTVMVITHEFGHLFGSPHTHACVWNGNNTVIDTCAGGVEGDCWDSNTDAPIIPATGGTIMSYCHQNAVGINFSSGFGTQPANRIINTINSASCLGTDCINSCRRTIDNLTITTVTETQASVSFTDTSTSTMWEYAVAPYGTPLSTWTSISTNAFTLTGLSPNSYYIVSVRNLCSAGTVCGSEFVYFTTQDFCQGITFYDTGGVSGNYADNETVIKTMTPLNAGEKIKINFLSFDTEPDYDFVYIYDGPTTNDTDLTAGGLSGNSISTTMYESTHPSGSLTFQFSSDVYVNRPGWEAAISCTNLGVDDLGGFIDFTYYPNPTQGKIIISSQDDIDTVEVYNTVGQLLSSKDFNDSTIEMDISSYEKGVYFFKVWINDISKEFKVIKE